jgi:hypothetical protein
VLNRSISRSRFGSATAAALLALLILSAGSVAASTSPSGDGTYTEMGTRADVYSGGCTPNGDDTTTCSDIGLSVFVGRMSDSFSGVIHGDQVCASVSSYTIDDVTGEQVGDGTYESGCRVDLPNGAIAVGKNLSSVKLSTTTVEIAQYICDEYTCEPGSSRDISVGGTWTGVGSIYQSKSHSSGDDGTCRTNESGRGSNREASFVGTIDTVAVGSDSFAWLGNGKYTYRSRCTEV